LAAEVVAGLLGGTSKSRDGVGAAEGMHDFDVELSDGNCIALEVTTIADKNVIEFHEVLADAANWAAAPQLKSDWLVAFPDPVGGEPVIKIKPRKPAIIDALKALETHGVQMLGPEALEPHLPLAASTPPAVQDSIGKLVSSGVTLVRSSGRRAADVARLEFSTHGSMVGNPDQLNALVLDEVRENHAKLAAAQAFERHLFLWLTDTYPDAEWAFSTLAPPSAPSIPPDLDVVWLARYALPIRLWRLRPPNAWEPVDIEDAASTGN
jgi:hypothetical protein